MNDVMTPLYNIAFQRCVDSCPISSRRPSMFDITRQRLTFLLAAAVTLVAAACGQRRPEASAAAAVVSPIYAPRPRRADVSPADASYEAVAGRTGWKLGLANNFGFNRVQRPETNPYPNQVFARPKG